MDVDVLENIIIKVPSEEVVLVELAEDIGSDVVVVGTSVQVVLVEVAGEEIVLVKVAGDVRNHIIIKVACRELLLVEVAGEEIVFVEVTGDVCNNVVIEVAGEEIVLVKVTGDVCNNIIIEVAGEEIVLVKVACRKLLLVEVTGEEIFVDFTRPEVVELAAGLGGLSGAVNRRGCGGRGVALLVVVFSVVCGLLDMQLLGPLLLMRLAFLGFIVRLMDPRLLLLGFQRLGLLVLLRRLGLVVRFQRLGLVVLRFQRLGLVVVSAHCLVMAPSHRAVLELAGGGEGPVVGRVMGAVVSKGVIRGGKLCGVACEMDFRLVGVLLVHAILEIGEFLVEIGICTGNELVFPLPGIELIVPITEGVVLVLSLIHGDHIVAQVTSLPSAIMGSG